MSLDWLSNSANIFWLTVAVMVCLPVALDYWRKMKRDELDASLKHEMIARGLSADEIERILKTHSGQKGE